MSVPSTMPSHENPAALGNAAITTTDLNAALDSALARIPPLWPLRHFVAVNPFVGLVDRPFHEACALLQRVAGAAPLQRPVEYRQAYGQGRIQPADLEEAADAAWTPAELMRALDTMAADETPRPLATMADLLDQERPRSHWGVFVTDEISKWCAVTFDQNQTTWNSPWKGRGLFTAWREAAVHDLNPEAFGLAGFRSLVASLPTDATRAIARSLEILETPAGDLTDFLHRQLITIAGWAGYVQYFVREDALRGRANPSLRELLAVRLAYDAALYQAFARDEIVRAAWRQRQTSRVDTRRIAALSRWQFVLKGAIRAHATWGLR